MRNKLQVKQFPSSESIFHKKLVPMSVVDYEIVSAEFSEAQQYKLRFQQSETTDTCATSTTHPTFKQKQLQSRISGIVSESPNFTYTIISVLTGKETVVEERTIHLPFSKDAVPITLKLSKTNGFALDGEINLKYKFSRASLVQSLKSDQIHCISIQAAHLNTLVETPFELKLSADRELKELCEPTTISNYKPNAYLNLSDHIDSVEDKEIRFMVVDTTTGNMYRVLLTPLSPMVVTIPMKFGEPLVLSLQCMYMNDPKAKMVTGTVHTSFMREASISQTPGSSARRFSLSPRRTTSFDQSAAAVGLLGTGQAIPSTKKTLLFLEDSLLNVKSTPNGFIVGGIQSAEQINSLGEVISSRPVENHHEAYLTELSTKLLGKEGLGKHVGPSSGAYIVCNSKSEVLASDLGKKTHKKQSHAINLGTMQIAHSSLTGPVRIRAKLVDLMFTAIAEPDEEESSAPSGPDNPDNPESTSGMAPSNGSGKGPAATPAPGAAESSLGHQKVRHQQRALIAYIGMLEETSRELFNETGLVSCTLEGKLFKPTAIQQASADGAVAPDAIDGGGGVEESDEACIAVKLYVSLVPSKGAAVTQDEEHSETESESEIEKEHTDSATDLKEARKQHKGKLSKQPSALDYEGIDKEILHSRASSEPFNVVTKETALPDELPGSSMLSLPSAKQPPEELLARNRSSSSSVPRLNLSGEKDTKPAKRLVGAFGEGIDAAAVVRAEANRRAAANHDHHTANTGAAFAKLVSEELEKKQRVIETLLEDVKLRSEAIQVCGFDIRALREEQIRLSTKIKSLEHEKELKAAEDAKADSLTSEILKYPHLMHELDKPALIRNMHKLREKVQGLDKDRAALQDALAHAKDLVQQFAALKKEHTNLHEAHLQQTKYLQKMQGKINQVAAFQETIKTQEKIISKMQSIVEAKMRSKNALPFLPKQPIPVPAPHPDNQFHPPDLPDFEALQAQKVNEEELFQARQEIQELNDKVQDLERQLFDAKLDAMNAAKVDDSGSDSDGESEVPNASTLQELAETDEQKANFNDLKGANERIDQLEVESTSKSYRISALEAQLETSTRDYSREIARLRTKLFELEISAAMASDDRASSAGDDNYMDMDMNFEQLLSMGDPSQPSHGKRTPGASRKNSARGSSREGGGPGMMTSPALSAAPTPSASRQQLVPPLGLEGQGPGSSSRPTSVATGSARAAVNALKESSAAPSRKSSASTFDGEKIAAAAKALELAEDHTPKQVEPENAHSSDNVSPTPSTEKLPKASASPLPSRNASVEKDLETIASKESLHPPEAGGEPREHGEPPRVPKFRNTSVAGFGAKGPQDPDAVDKVVDFAVEIIDSDQESPRAEATIRTKKDNKILMAMLNVTVHYHYDHVRKLSTFNLQRVRLHGFSQELLQDRFEPYLKLSYGNEKWKCVTSHTKSTGQVAEWTFNPDEAFFDKMFKVTDDEMSVADQSVFRCVVKKKNVKGHEDFECGEGSIVFTSKLFNPDETSGEGL